MRRLIFCLLACACLPSFVSAAEPVTRRDGFLIMWKGIHRPVLPTSEKPFSDVRSGEEGFAEITYAKSRGLIDDANPVFHPDDTLTLRDALLFLFRTRNVDDISDLTLENLHTLLERYPLVTIRANGLLDQLSSQTIIEEELHSLQSRLDLMLAEERHEVSLYSEKFHGKGTAFGESFDMHALTAAHRTFPHNTLVKVTNIENGKSVTVRINDRGPFVEGRDMDLSLASFTTIAERSKGKIRARFERLGDASMVAVSGSSSDSLSVSDSKDEDPEEDRKISSCISNFAWQQRLSRTTKLKPGIQRIVGLGDVIVIAGDHRILFEAIEHPNKMRERLHQWIGEGQEHRFTPFVEGEYRLLIGPEQGRRRWFSVKVQKCE